MKKLHLFEEQPRKTYLKALDKVFIDSCAVRFASLNNFPFLFMLFSQLCDRHPM